MRCLSLLLISITSVALHSQTTIVTPPQHEWNAFYYQDSRNITWISSLKHWNTYDGNTVKPFGDPLLADAGGYIQSDLFEDGTGRLWYSTEKGLFYLDPEHEEIIQAELPDVLKGSFFAFHLEQSNEQLWFADEGGIRSFDLNTSVLKSIPLLTESVRFSVATFADGLPRVIAGALYSNGVGFELYSRASPEAEWVYQKLTTLRGKPMSYVRNLLFTGPELLLLATDEGLFSYHLQTHEARLVQSGTIHDLSLSKDRQQVSCSVLGSSIKTFSLDSTGMICELTKEWMYPNVHEVNYDQSNRLWFHRPGLGVEYIPNQANLFVQNFPELAAYSLVDLIRGPLGELFTLSENGTVFFLNREMEEWQDIFSIKSTEEFQHLSADESFLYLHTPRQILKLRRGINKQLHEPKWSPGREMLQQLTHHAKGSKMLLDFNAVYSFDGETLTRKPEVQKYFKGFDKFAFDYMKYTGRNTLFLALDSEYLLELNWNEESVSEVRRTKLPGDIMSVVLGCTPEAVLVGTNVGLYEISGDEAIPIESDLDPIGTVKSILCRKYGQIVMGTDNGLVIYWPESKEAKRYQVTEGLPDNNFILDAIVEDENNNIWMLTAAGLIKFSPDSLPAIEYTYEPVVENIWINNLPFEDTIAPSFINKLDLGFRENTLNFKVSNTGYEQVERSKITYRLQGYDTTWVNIDNGGYARFTKVPPGNYSLEFKSVDPYGHISGERHIQVNIAPPFYKTTWFIGLCTLAFILTGYTLNRRAIRRETARQQAIQQEQARQAEETLARHQAVVHEQRRIMMELHDDLGGTLGSLFYKLDGYLLDHESGLPVNPDFEQLKNTSGEAMKKLREVMKSNVAKELPLPVFARKLTDMARAMAQNAKLEWKLERDESFPELELSSQQVHNALLIIKEALQNIRKHAKASTFSMQLHLEKDKTFLVSLADDGIGMPSTEPSDRNDGTGNGLHNMYRRAADLGGTLTFKTPPKGGTVFQLRFPITEQT